MRTRGEGLDQGHKGRVCDLDPQSRLFPRQWAHSCLEIKDHKRFRMSPCSSLHTLSGLHVRGDKWLKPRGLGDSGEVLGMGLQAFSIWGSHYQAVVQDRPALKWGPPDASEGDGRKGGLSGLGKAMRELTWKNKAFRGLPGALGGTLDGASEIWGLEQGGRCLSL